MNAWSNSAASTLRRPRAGIVQRTRARPRKPSSTTKWLKFQNSDRGQRQLGELARLLAEAARDEAVGARRAQQPAGLAAVAAHAALDAHLLERHVAAVVGEHHRERGGAALDALELQDRRRAPTGVPAAARCGAVVSASARRQQPCGEGGDERRAATASAASSARG